MKVMFLDESGDHNLNPKKINPNYPIFALGGVIVDRKYVREVIGPEMRAFKQRHFEREDIVLHTVEMGKARGDYGFLQNPLNRDRFYTELNDLLSQWDYKVVVCTLHKQRFVQKYSNPADPYHYSLEILIDRFCLDLSTATDEGFICAEMRNPGVDKELMRAWEKLKTEGWGTGYTRSKTIEEKIVGFELQDKNPHLYGLQLADLVVTPAARHVAGQPPKPHQVQWSVVENKLRRVGGTYRGMGLITRP